MMGIKRNLFPEHSAMNSSGALSADTAQRKGNAALGRKRKRNATMAIKVVKGDSLASVLGKENTQPIRTGKGSRQRKEKSHNSQTFEPSMLMGIDLKENISNNEGKQRTRQQNITSDQNCTNKSSKNRRVLSDATGSVLVSFDASNRLRPSSRTLSRTSSRTSSRIASKRGRPARSSKGITTEAKPKHGTRNNHSSKIPKRVYLKESEANSDSLMTCLQENSKIMAEKVLVGSERIREQSKPRGAQRKRSDKRSTKNRPRKAKLANESKPRNTSQSNSNRTIVTSCKVSGLGAFAGIIRESSSDGNSRKEQSVMRFVSPLEDLKPNCEASVKVQETNIAVEDIRKNNEDTTSNAPTLGKVPSVIIVSLPQQSQQLPRPETRRAFEAPLKEDIETFKGGVVPKELEMKNQNSEKAAAIVIAGQTCSKSEAKSKKKFTQKFSVGTKFQKNFEFHGWFSGTVVSFESETGFYKVHYEDGDTEDLDENELEKCVLQLDTSESANLDDKLQVSTSTQEPNVAVEQSAPLRRSRRQVGNSIKYFDDGQSNVTNNRSLRRSKRRKSQPERLIDGEQATRSTGSEKAKRKDENSEKKRIKTSRVEDPDLTPGIDDIRLKQNCAVSPSNFILDNRDKQQFDDALKAVMPVDNIPLRFTNDLSQMQDDIFDSTPMKKLFTKRLSNANESSSANKGREKSRGAERRSRRKSIEPERYGYSEKVSKKDDKSHPEAESPKKNAKSKAEIKSSKKKRSATKSSKKKTKSALKRSKRNTKGSLTTKKRVRISIEPPAVTNFVSHEEQTETDHWTKADLRALHRAHREVDPTSFSFWEDVSEIIGSRSAFECRQKWFSLAKTPEPKKAKPKKKGNKDMNATASVHNFEDDIFNSTPMRSAFAIGENIDVSATAFEELGEFSKINVGSAIKINRPDQSDEEQPSNHDDLVSCPHGYKTYLQKMGRIMRQKDTRKRQTSERTNDPTLAIGKKLAERIEEGDVQVKGRLSPGGTLRVDTFGYSDTEDYLDYDDETE